MSTRGFRAPSGVVLAAAAALTVLPAVGTAVASPSETQDITSSLTGSSALSGSSDAGSSSGTAGPHRQRRSLRRFRRGRRR